MDFGQGFALVYEMREGVMRIAIAVFLVGWVIIIGPAAVAAYYRNWSRFWSCVRMMSIALLGVVLGSAFIAALVLSCAGVYYAPYFAGALFLALLFPIAYEMSRNARKPVRHIRPHRADYR